MLTSSVSSRDDIRHHLEQAVSTPEGFLNVDDIDEVLNRQRNVCSIAVAMLISVCAQLCGVAHLGAGTVSKPHPAAYRSARRRLVKGIRRRKGKLEEVTHGSNRIAGSHIEQQILR